MVALILSSFLTDSSVKNFLYGYDEVVLRQVLQLRKVIAAHLPEIIEQIDAKAKMIGYCYGQKYKELICVIIPSKKSAKLGFSKGQIFRMLMVYWKGPGKYRAMLWSGMRMI